MSPEQRVTFGMYIRPFVGGGNAGASLGVGLLPLLTVFGVTTFGRAGVLGNGIVGLPRN